MVAGQVVYIEEDGDLIPMTVNGYEKRRLSLIYPKGHPRAGHSEFFRASDLIEPNQWYEEQERKENEAKIKHHIRFSRIDLLTGRVLMQILKI